MDEPDSLKKPGAVTAEFERNLETLILEAFTQGATPEGTWTIELPVEDAPDWRVEISKTSPVEHTTEDSEFITD